MGRPRTEIHLTEEERGTLEMWVRAGRTEQRLVQRAKTILLIDKGLPWKEICAQTGLSLINSLKWQRRFLERRLDGLMDAPRKGRPAEIEPGVKLSVTALACTKPKDGCTRWSIRRLAKETGVSKSTVQRILAEGKLKPHKTDYWCGRSPDPEFEQKQAAILGLYLDPPAGALVLSVDEKSQIQALDRTQPELPLRPGRPARQTVTYKRNGTTCLLAALAVHAGEVDGRCVERHTHEEFLAYLKYLYRKYPRVQLHVIIDNFSAHKHKKVMEWAKRKRRLTLHFTPTYASWLNQIEIWFNIFTKDVVKGGIWRSKQELINQIMKYIREYNKSRAKPFRWTYTGKPLTV